MDTFWKKEGHCQNSNPATYLATPLNFAETQFFPWLRQAKATRRSWCLGIGNRLPPPGLEKCMKNRAGWEISHPFPNQTDNNRKQHSKSNTPRDLVHTHAHHIEVCLKYDFSSFPNTTIQINSWYILTYIKPETWNRKNLNRPLGWRFEISIFSCSSKVDSQFLNMHKSRVYEALVAKQNKIKSCLTRMKLETQLKASKQQFELTMWCVCTSWPSISNNANWSRNKMKMMARQDMRI